MSTRISFGIVLIFLFLPTYGFGDIGQEEEWTAMPLPEGYERVDHVVAQVGSELITLHEVEEAAKTNQSLGAADPLGGKEYLREALKALIDDRLILQEAKNLELTVTSAEIEDHLQKTREQNNWTIAQLEENVARLGMTLDEYRTLTRNERLKGKVVSVKVGSRVNVGPSDVQRVLDAEYSGGASEDEARASILLRHLSPEWTDVQVQEARRYAAWIQSQAAAAPERFADLARKFSEHDATRFSGGDLGFFRRGTFSLEALEKAAFSMKPGSVSPVLSTPHGLIIVYVQEKKKVPVVDLAGLKDSIYKRLFAEARVRVYRDWVEELRKAAFIRTRL